MTWHFYTSPQPNGCPVVGDHRGKMICMLTHSVRDPEQRDIALELANKIAAVPDMYSFIQAKADQGDVEAVKLLKSIEDGDRHTRPSKKRR